MDKIAVVILNWNGCEMLRSFLPSVVRFSEADGAVVYVADNGSTDASVEMLCREFPTVRLILLEENQGFADGYNMALQEVDAEYVVLLNSDVEVTEHWLQPLADYMEAHPEAKAILLVYPNYYGIGVDIVNIVKEAHKRGLIVLVDEAHGPHLPFSESLPVEAIEAGADLVAQSTHKSVGSLTQTSWLLGQGKKIDKRRITQMHQMLQSTSPNYIFLASLDMARHQLATAGNDLVSRALELSMYLREELNKISGIATMEYTDIQERVINYDCTKVLIDAKGLGLTGVEFEHLLRNHRIEVELVQANHVLVLITIGDTNESVTALIKAVQAVSEKVLRTFKEFNNAEEEQLQDISKDSALLPAPIVRITPRNAMYANREQIPLKEALHRIAGETIAYYPPGIPCVAVGEEISASVLQYIENRKALGYVPNGSDDMTLETIWVLQE